jgi:phenylacetate-CoA ligase
MKIQNALIRDFSDFSQGDIQHLPEEQIEPLQVELINKHLDYAVQKSVFYKTFYADQNIQKPKINNLSDLALLPATTKDHLIQFNNDFLAAPQDEIVDVCLTSATSGEKPAMLLQTSEDLARLAYNEEIAFKMTGLNEKDTLLVCAALDRAFMAGLAYFLGGVKIKSKVVRGGSGSAAQLWQLIKVTKATAIVGVPSLVRKIAEYGIESGEDPQKIGVKKLIAIGEPIRDEQLELLPLAAKLEEMWEAKLFSTYASTELATTYCECPERKGGHLRPEMIVTEIVDDHDQPLPDGQKGEVVVTPLGVTGMPLVRFKTGDISFIIKEKCACGRTTKRLGPILGRKHQMLKFKGTTIFPNSVISALEGSKYYDCGYVEVQKNEDGTDHVILHVAVNSPVDCRVIEEELRAKVRVVPEISIEPKNVVEEVVFQPEKKRKRVIFLDSRN